MMFSTTQSASWNELVLCKSFCVPQLTPHKARWQSHAWGESEWEGSQRLCRLFQALPAFIEHLLCACHMPRTQELSL